MAVTLSQDEVRAATDFLESYLTDAVPEGDFTPGSALRDLCITAIAHVFALLRKEVTQVKARQSLSGLAALPPGADVDEAVDAILSNYFISRKNGRAALVNATLYFSAPVNVTIFAGTKFFRQNGLAFIPASGADTYVPASSLLPRPVSSVKTEYSTDLVLLCTSDGTAGNVLPGTFVATDNISNNFLRAETLGQGYGGYDKETTTALLARAPLALSSRNMVSRRTITNLLLDTLPAVTAVTVIGTGEPEMVRDVIRVPGGSLRVHVGGMVDVYSRLPRASRVAAGLSVGGLYAHSAGLPVTLRDLATDFLANHVEVGDVLRVTSGLGVNAADTYLITSVAKNEITVSARTPFTYATDELVAAPPVTYTVGRYAPYEDKLSLRAGVTSRKTRVSGTVVMPAGPVYQIIGIRVPASGMEVAQRTNYLPPEVATYGVSLADPALAQSGKATVIVTLPPEITDGTVVDITYDTVASSDLATVQSTLSDPNNRTVATDQLARVPHPVYVSLRITYDVKTGAVDPGSAALKAAVVAYVEGATFGELSVGNLLAELVRALPQLSQIAIGSLEYWLLSPDGQVLPYVTTDVVTLEPEADNGVQFAGATRMRTQTQRDALAACAYSWASDVDATDARKKADAALVEYLTDLGVSDRTTRYMTGLTYIDVFRRGTYDSGEVGSA